MRRLLALMVAPLLLAGCGGAADAPASLDAGEVESEVARQLGQDGPSPQSVDCEDSLRAEVDARVRCVLTASDQSRIGATVTVTAVDGQRVEFGIEVDDEPIG